MIAFAAGIWWTSSFFISSNSKTVTQYETHNPFFASIEKKTVITGKVIPQDEIEIKPQVSGIIDQVYLEEGDAVEKGDLIATVKVVPNEQSLTQAKGRVNNAKVALHFAEIDFKRNKKLHDGEIISTEDFQKIEFAYRQAKISLENANNDYQIILKGSIGGATSSNTYIRSTVNGTLLEIPVKRGDQVIQSNNFNNGTTIAIIADLTKMIFEGKVDEGEVGKLAVGMPLVITIGAMPDKPLEATLKFIAPKSIEESGAVQFKIKGDIKISNEFILRAGYSANASLILERKENILVIPEALLQFDNGTSAAYVEVASAPQEFQRRDLEIGISDGINAEVVHGLKETDEVKQWNKTEPIKTGETKRQRTSEGSDPTQRQ